MKRLIGRQRGIRRAHLRRQLAVGQIVADEGVQERHLALHHRHIHLLSATGFFLHAQRRHDAERGIQPRCQIGDGDAAAHAASARLAGDADHAAFGLQYQIERRAVFIRPGLAEAGDRAVDDAGVAGLGFFVIEAEFFQRADAKIFNHHIATLDHIKKDRLAARVFEVDFNALFVAV